MCPSNLPSLIGEFFWQKNELILDIFNCQKWEKSIIIVKILYLIFSVKPKLYQKLIKDFLYFIFGLAKCS
jgi:hypothetical protein